jgi:hypothetical protein
MVGNDGGWLMEMDSEGSESMSNFSKSRSKIDRNAMNELFS